MIRKSAWVVLSCLVFVLGAPPVDASFMGGVKKATSGVGRFVKKHKKELLVGAGVVVGMKLADNNLLGAAVGGLVGYGIAKALTPPNKRRMVRSTQTSLVTGESSEWHDKKTGVRGRTAVKEEKVADKTVTATYMKDRIAELPPLELNVGGQYKLIEDANLRGGPGDDYQSHEDLKKDQTVDIIAKVENKPWYVMSRNGAAVGFVDSKYLEATGVPVDATHKPAKGDESIAAVEVTAKQTCRSVEQQVTNKKGKVVSQTIQACQQPDGTWS
ncbi:MAG: hypothetical protein KJ558_09495 [Gammaproteobacteria bacterium]|nr:hypothetical protein [Gammaproteobacteria bacterium]MBU1655040.1 hypothetical protein [Gammaproteobacteria bacterium]MBU1961537.1 hypothetical protein [Gammaproteobacteria bacterium]